MATLYVPLLRQKKFDIWHVSRVLVGCAIPCILLLAISFTIALSLLGVFPHSGRVSFLPEHLASHGGLTTGSLPESLVQSALQHRNHTAISDFRLLNRRLMSECRLNLNSRIEILVSDSSLSDEQNVTVNVKGILFPSSSDWVGMITPSDASADACLIKKLDYYQTGDFAHLPLLCHYPVKAQYVSNDPDYLSCKKSECLCKVFGWCLKKTCGATLSFHVINLRTDIEFVLFALGFTVPCILKRSEPISFANPNKPLHGHLSSIDSTGASMRLTWVSGDKTPQQVQYGDGQKATSSVTTFTQKDMCPLLAVNIWPYVINSPAVDYGWHDPGYIHSAVMTGLQPSSHFSYKYGSDASGWSSQIAFKTPPAAGISDKLVFLVFGDMGKTPLDDSVEHYIQPGAASVVKAMIHEVANGSIDVIYHIGDISYATGFLVEWDYFLNLITPLASKVSYMTAIGNHERDYWNSGSNYVLTDSGGECGVPYETYFPMPTPAKDKPWYSIEQGTVHFIVISTEHDFSVYSEQYRWMNEDMAAVDRTRTPWLIFTGHRPLYSSTKPAPVIGRFDPAVDVKFVEAVEPLLLQNKVDLALFGHAHNYERTCAVYDHKCKAMPKKNDLGVDTYEFSEYSAPVHVVVGTGGFTLDGFSWHPETSLCQISNYGYAKVIATEKELQFEFVNADSRKTEDIFQIIKS